ncbi:hypothetical protein ACQY0O_007629 [Thecaphora frezii]
MQHLLPLLTLLLLATTTSTLALAPGRFHEFPGSPILASTPAPDPAITNQGGTTNAAGTFDVSPLATSTSYVFQSARQTSTFTVSSPRFKPTTAVSPGAATRNGVKSTANPTSTAAARAGGGGGAALTTSTSSQTASAPGSTQGAGGGQGDLTLAKSPAAKLGVARYEAIVAAFAAIVLVAVMVG